jgi:acyl-CoA thioesterase FadM
MALKIDIRGMVWKYPDHFEVSREQIRQYARAVKADDPASYDDDAARQLGHDSLVAPLTFTAVFAVMIQRHFFKHVDVGMETMQIVQVDQKFHFHRPIRAGDKLVGTMYVHSVEERFGADIVVTRNILEDDTGGLIMESYTTMMGHEGDHSISVKWDPDSGQVVRTAVSE